MTMHAQDLNMQDVLDALDHGADQATALFVASLPLGRFIGLEYTARGKVQGRGKDKRRRGQHRSAYVLLVGVRYTGPGGICDRSYQALSGLAPSAFVDDATPLDVALEAHAELLDSLRLSALGENSATTDDAYAPLIVEGATVPGAKVHTDGSIHISGVLVSRRTIVEAEPVLPTKSSPKVRAKNRMRALLPIARWRQFRISEDQNPRFSYTA